MSASSESAIPSAAQLEGVCFSSPVDVILWASRVYLGHKVFGDEPPAVLKAAFDEARIPYMLDALCRILDRLLANADGQLAVHRVGCESTAIYEQALITGIRCLNRDYGEGYVAAMACVLSPSLVRVSRSDMEILASAFGHMERIWPRSDGEAATALTAGRAAGPLVDGYGTEFTADGIEQSQHAPCRLDTRQEFERFNGHQSTDGTGHRA